MISRSRSSDRVTGFLFRPLPHEAIRRFTTFGFVGLIGTGAHYFTLVVLVEAGVMHPVGATTVGFLIGALVNYALNHRYTFRSTKAHRDAAPKFLLIAAVTGVLNALLVYAGVDLMDGQYLLVQVLATVIVFLANFSLNTLWTFREAHSR